MKEARFAPLTAETAPEAARPLLRGSAAQFGFLPSPVARAARSPELLKSLFAGFASFDRSSLSRVEREVVALTVAFENECHYCMAMHSALLLRTPELAPVVAALRAGAPQPDPRLEALRRFTLAVYNGKGRVDAATWEMFTAAGFGEAEALDVVLGVGVYVMSTLANVLTDAPVDPPFAGQTWTKPAVRGGAGGKTDPMYMAVG